MLKRFIITAILFSFVSCNKNIYYVYEDSENYCAFEINRKSDIVTYRAKSVANSSYYSFVCLLSEGYYLADGLETFLSLSRYFDLFYVNHPNERRISNCVFCSVDADTIVSDKLVTYTSFEEAKDTLELMGKPIIIDSPLLRGGKIDWFPPYVVQRDEIDYKKFGHSRIKRRHLKNPYKAPMSF